MFERALLVLFAYDSIAKCRKQAFTATVEDRDICSRTESANANI
jgi:hypothetical protein